MKNGSKETLEAKIANSNEQAKKLYSYVTDVARRVGETTTSSRSIPDLFATHLEVQRQKLRDNCEKLLFLDPLNYGKKAIELLWRKVYYEIVCIAKKLQESDTEYDSYLFTHIVCGIGHFQHLITRIQSEIKVYFKELDYIPLHTDEEIGELNQTPDDEELQFRKFALHSCLIYLGDLSRYQAEIFHTFDSSIAARYYLQAAHIDKSSGMPYNQLGNLYLDKNYNLDSVCYYIHCLSCASPFDGAMGNLLKIFEKNSQFCETLNVSETLTQTEHIQNTIANFLSLIEIWYFGNNDANIPQKCNTIAHELKIALDFNKSALPDINKNYDDYIQAIEEESINPSYFNCNLVHKTVLICLLTLTKMVETDESKAFACKAFTLALLSQLLQKLLQQIEAFGLKNPSHNYRAKVFHTQHSKEEQVKEIETKQESIVFEKNLVTGVSIEDSKEETLEMVVILEDNEKLQNGDPKSNSKKTPAKRRRRRRIASSESSDMSDADTESSEVDTNESESGDETSDSTYDSEDVDVKSDDSVYDGTDTEEFDPKLNGNVEKEKLKDIKQDAELNGDVSVKPTESNNKDELLQIQDIQNFLLGNNFLPSIKLLQDWILSEKDLILSCGDSGETLFQCVVDLLNIFSHYFKSKSEVYENKDCKVLKYAKHVAEKLMFEYKTIPLPEDVNLRGTNICKFDKDAAEWQILDRYTPSVYEENIIRILNFIDFGNQIAKVVPRIRFNRIMKIFYLKKTQSPKLNTKLNHKRSREWHNSKKQHTESEVNEVGTGAGGMSGLPRRLGRLWLASQVRELERSGRAAAAATPVLLVLDTAALNIHLRKVKHLLRARNFILLVPSVVLQELDDLKREQSSARDAIRWLEIQLKSGSRFLRAQRPGQSRPLPLLKYPRKAPPHILNYLQILEFCNHFTADEKQTQGGNGDPDSSVQGKSTPLLILLVGKEPGSDEQHKEFSMTGAAQATGISMEHIGDFYTKWRQSVHKNGKKR
ncbi:nonsense-mediated mRNA decay factor SMG5 [Achroia grisella]|uniref:nonsense-mediated mRNA decay factor SMG5 n=1 Tax=Achroia grisella TaxID=688607 RepID=UPI0027D2DABD|nr:nonsense-mediated mRNA decay factor SMG5 [Achroia grisella]